MVVEEEDLKLKMNVGIVEKRDIGKMNVENHKENGLDQNDQNLEVLHLVRQEADLTKEKAKKNIEAPAVAQDLIAKTENILKENKKINQNLNPNPNRSNQNQVLKARKAKNLVQKKMIK